MWFAWIETHGGKPMVDVVGTGKTEDEARAALKACYRGGFTGWRAALADGWFATIDAGEDAKWATRTQEVED